MNLNKFFLNLNTSMFKDFILNIIASLIFTIATQLLAYPYLSRIMSNTHYGVLLTLMGGVNAIGVALGNPLNNTRILLQSEYDKKRLEGDFNIIFLGTAVIDIITVSILTKIFFKGYNNVMIGCSIISVLILYRSYYSASYRIIINFKKNLYSSICGFAGYLLGLYMTHLTNIWVFIFIFGELFSCIYIFFTGHIVYDKFQITELFRKSLMKYLLIMSAAILSSFMTYMDRFFIYPILGAEQVSVYNVASFLGKTAGIVMTPITGVLLTYYAKENKLTISRFYKRMVLFIGGAFVFYLGIISIGFPVTKILYPTIIESAAPYFSMANLANIVFILGNTIQPTLLRFCHAKWQPVIQGTYFLSYLSLGIIGMKLQSLLGFCYAVFTANIIKILLMLSITTFTLYKNKEKGD